MFRRATRALELLDSIYRKNGALPGTPEARAPRRHSLLGDTCDCDRRTRRIDRQRIRKWHEMAEPYEVEISSLSSLTSLPTWVSPWRDITQEDFDSFAKVTGDHAWIHIDIDRAEREIGGTIAHGYFLLSLLPALGKGYYCVRDMRRGLNYGCEKVRYLQQVHAGTRLRLRQKVTDVSPRGDGWLITHESVLESEEIDKPACFAVTLSLIF
jgi:acyl dehydratase